MKNKAKTPTPSTTIIIDSNNSSSIGSKNISFVDNKKEYKYISRLNKKQKNRQINSLDELTKKFSKCVYFSKSDKINLNNVMKKIKAKKRRIYDITNVMEGKTIFILIFNLVIIIGIGLIEKDQKNQIRLKSDFYELYENNENNNLIDLNEGNEQNNDIKNEIKRSQGKELKKEINYLRQLIKTTDEKLSKENQNNNIINIENLDEILDLKSNSNFEIQPNNFKTKDISGKKDAKKLESLTMTKLELEEQINYPMNSNKLCMDPNKKEDLFRFKKVDENLEINEEYMGLFIPENIKNDFNYEILKNGGMDFDLRKDSFISDLSNIENLNNLIDIDQLYE
jgi:hypothetical protein